MYCIVCGDKAVRRGHGYYFCHKHRKYAVLDPEDMEFIVMDRITDVPTAEIEKKLDDLLSYYMEDPD